MKSKLLVAVLCCQLVVHFSVGIGDSVIGPSQISFSFFYQLDDLDLADDSALLSHNHEQLQAKTTSLQTTSSKIGLKINTEKTKVVRINIRRKEPIKLGDNEIEDVTSFTYLGSIVGTIRGTDWDIKIRIGNTRTAYIILQKVWNSQELSRPTKLKYSTET